MTTDVERYLTEIDRRLPGPRRARTEVIDELRDGLLTSIAEHEPSDHHRVIAEFGAPRYLAATLGREIRLRVARRNALQVVALLLVMTIGWRFYDVRVGTPDTMIPTGWARALFLTGTTAIQAAPVVALASALLLAIITSLRGAQLTPVLRVLAEASTAAIVTFGLAALVILATVTSEHRVQANALGIPLLALLVILLHSAYRMAHHTRRAA